MAAAARVELVKAVAFSVVAVLLFARLSVEVVVSDNDEEDGEDNEEEEEGVDVVGSHPKRFSMAFRTRGWCTTMACCTFGLMAALHNAPAATKARLRRGPDNNDDCDGGGG